jgi:hypothetical protein
LLSHNQVQIMDGERQCGVSPCGGFARHAGFKASASVFETQAQGKLFVGVTELAEEATDFVGTLAGGADGAQGRSEFNCSRGDCLEEGALEVTAARWAVGVDSAAAVGAERDARLRKFDPRPRTCRGSRTIFQPARAPFECQPERLQLCFVVSGLQFDVFEKDAIAAQAALEAELLRDGGSGWRRHGRGEIDTTGRCRNATEL